MPKKQSKPRVVYGVISIPYVAPGKDHTIFALRDEAQRTANLRVALTTATTWGEFRELTDPTSLEEAANHCGAFYETYEEFCAMGGLEPDSDQARTEYAALAVGQRKPLDGDPFERTQIRALVDGDWPHRLERATAAWMPERILQQYASLIAAIGGAAGYTFDPEDRGKIARALRTHGFTVRREDAMVLAAQYGVRPAVGPNPD